MAPRDGDENGMERRPRQPQPVAPADGSDGEDDDIVDDDIVDDDVNEDDLNEDSEDEMDSDDEVQEEEDPVARELRMQTLRTENEEIVAQRMEQDLMLKEINWKTEDIKAATLAKSDELAQLKEARRLREEEVSGGAGANPEANPDPS